jgi:hypothetical protein
MSHPPSIAWQAHAKHAAEKVRQIFNVNVQIARLIGLEGAVLWLRLFDLQGAQITHPVTAQASIQARA